MLKTLGGIALSQPTKEEIFNPKVHDFFLSRVLVEKVSNFGIKVEKMKLPKFQTANFWRRIFSCLFLLPQNPIGPYGGHRGGLDMLLSGNVVLNIR